MKYFSMFSGIGGFEYGIQKATEGKWECVGFSETDKYAIKTYQKYFPAHKNFGDATTINPKGLPDFELLCAGFPCQTFSIMGKRMGFKDTRGTLFFEIARIVKEKRPQLILLENVKGLLSHDKGRTFAVILATLDELGYNAEWQCLNSKYFGVPQSRERVFIIGHLRGKSSRQVFPIRQNGEADFSLQTITSRYFASGSNGSYISYPEERRETNQEGISNALSGVQKDNLVLDTPYSMGSTKQNRSTIGSQRVPEIGNKEMSIRRLTPIECERLQSFPDGWTEGVSNSQRYKQIGNAVTTNVIQEIIRKIQREQTKLNEVKV